MTSLRRCVRFVSLAVAALTLASCTVGSTTTASEPIGRWGDVDDSGTYLSLLEDGTTLGSDGCNGFGGKWEQLDGTLSFSDTYTTLMACPGGDQWLSALSTAVVVGTSLYVRNSDGDEIGVLPRASEGTQ